VQGDGARIYSWDAECTIADNNDGVIKAAPATGRFIQSNEGTLSPALSANNLPALNSALSLRKLSILPEMDMLVPTKPVNPLGFELNGFGRVLMPITGGNQQLNLQADKGQHVFGQEYLSAFQNKIQLRSGCKMVFSGDSTTAGDAVSGKGQIGYLTQLTIQDAGFEVSQINAGHSGKTSTDWLGYIAGDLANNPDLYIVRWGINDPFFPGGTIEQFASNMRQGLATVRASKSISQMSILLMCPNSTSDTPNNRDERWYEQVRLVLRQAARDFQCAFIDTYSLWVDSRGAATIWMDNPYGDGRAIHPLEIMNDWIASKIADLLIPSTLKVKNYPSTNVNLATNVPPSSFPLGTSYWRATNFNGVDGTVINTRHVDGGCLQEVIPKLFAKKTLRRSGTVVDGWFGWIDSFIAGFSYQNNWNNRNPSSENPAGYSKSNGVVYLNGRLNVGATADNTVIAVLPNGFCPPFDCFYLVLNGPALQSTARIYIQPSGEIKVNTGMQGGLVDLSGISFVL
jgi:lysophospholipase L1-like esterase